MDDESGDDNRDELTSEWGGETWLARLTERIRELIPETDSGITCRKSANYAQRFSGLRAPFLQIIRELYSLNISLSHSTSFEMTHLSRESLCQYSIVTAAISLIISETKWDIGRKLLFFHTACIWRPVRGSPSKYCHTVSYGKTRIVWLPDGVKCLICLAISIEYRRVMDRRMDVLRHHSPHSKKQDLRCFLSKNWYAYQRVPTVNANISKLNVCRFKKNK